MTTMQAIIFGATLVCVPSLIILAISLWNVRELDGMD
jgi:hypothetical protein